MANAFNWNTGQPSEASKDRAMRTTTTGTSYSAVAKKAVRTRKAKGENPGYVAGISKKSVRRSFR